jgi:hypothetical protein
MAVPILLRLGSELGSDVLARRPQLQEPGVTLNLAGVLRRGHGINNLFSEQKYSLQRTRRKLRKRQNKEAISRKRSVTNSSCFPCIPYGFLALRSPRSLR